MNIKKKIIYVLNIIHPISVARPMTKFILKEGKMIDMYGLEIGTYRGENAYNMLRLLDIKKMFLVDPYLPNATGCIHYKKAKSILRKWKNKVYFRMAKSEDASKMFRDNYLDFIYIDGDHSYKAVKKDIELYYPKVSEGGVIGGHDFCGSCPGVCRAVIEFCDKNNIKFQSWDKDWWFVK